MLTADERAKVVITMGTLRLPIAAVLLVASAEQVLLSDEQAGGSLPAAELLTDIVTSMCDCYVAGLEERANEQLARDDAVRAHGMQVALLYSTDHNLFNAALAPELELQGNAAGPDEAAGSLPSERQHLSDFLCARVLCSCLRRQSTWMCVAGKRARHRQLFGESVMAALLVLSSRRMAPAMIEGGGAETRNQASGEC